jgi:phosphatidylglycerol:prolipoprotein diacylglycerol transferase
LIGAWFLIGYGVLRFVAEFAREPDDFLGLLAFKLSMGQWLSLPMIALGLVLMFYFVRKTPAPVAAPAPQTAKERHKK